MGKDKKINQGNKQIMTLAEFHQLTQNQKGLLLHQCCGSRAWVNKMLQLPAQKTITDLFKDAEEKWNDCDEDDWKEAFSHHPKIGDLDSLRKKFSSDQFAGGEQSSINSASEQILQALAEGNKLYEQKFGYIFIVCATGKSPGEMLQILNSRLQNNPADEIKIASEEQNKITKLRLQKLFDT